MPTAVRIGIVGAGSAQFSLDIVKDLCLTESLAGSHVCFMDPDSDRLDLVNKLGSRYAAELGADLTFEGTADQTVCLRDADFVINMAYVRGHQHEWDMRALAAKHGYYYDGVQLGDFYQLQLALEIARNMERLCPDAWLLQLANPVFNCSTLVTRETSTKTCGLCHGHYQYRVIAEALGLDPDRVQWQAPGFNHNIWLAQFTLDGQDLYPLIDQWIENEAEEYWLTHTADHTHDVQMSRGAVNQYHMYGLFGIGDTVRRVGGGYTVGCTAYRGEWWLHTDLATQKYWFGEPWGGPDNEVARRHFGKDLAKRMSDLINLVRDPGASLIETLGVTKSWEQVAPIMDALVNDNLAQYQVNVPNQRAIQGIPDDVVVEVAAMVSQKGIQPVRVGALPPKIMLECLLPHWLDMERNLLAFATGDRSILLWNALDSHQTRSYDQAVAVVEDMLSLAGHEEMNSHFVYPWEPPNVRSQ